MFKLPSHRYGPLADSYSGNKFFFPIIAAVLSNRQNGVVYVDSLDNPEQFYAEHEFGFAQLVGPSQTKSRFIEGIHSRFINKDKFQSNKIRLYCPENFLISEIISQDIVLSKRQRFILNWQKWNFSDTDQMVGNSEQVTIAEVTEKDLNEIETEFFNLTRFWKNKKDYLDYSMAWIIRADTDIAAICYSAATESGQAEIDVFTQPVYRHNNYAKMVVNSFVNHCRQQNIIPLWDCFHNNEASMGLAKSVGFEEIELPYDFYTINMD